MMKIIKNTHYSYNNPHILKYHKLPLQEHSQWKEMNILNRTEIGE